MVRLRWFAPYALFTLATVCSSSSFVAHAQEAGNLVANPSLETPQTGNSGRPAGWTPASWGDNTASFTYANDGASGRRSVRVDITRYASGDAKWVFDSVAIEPGKAYVYRDSYKSTVPSRIVAAYTSTTGSMSYRTLVVSPQASTWTAAEADFTPPSSTARITLYHLIDSVGTLQVDDVSLTPHVTPPTEPPSGNSGVANGSFEEPYDATGSLPRGWRPSSWGTNQPTFTYATFGRTGNHSGQLSVDAYVDGDAKWTFDPIPIRPGGRYLYSDYYTANVESFVVAEFRLGDGTVQYQNLGDQPPRSGFSAMRAAFTAPRNAVSATVFHGLRRNGMLTIDDVGIAALPDTPLVQGVPNGDLEQQAFPGATMPAGWYTNRYGNHDSAFSYPTNGHSGTRSLRVDIGTFESGRAGWYFDPQVVGGGSYRFRDWYRASADTTVVVQTWNADGKEDYLQLPPAFASSAWKEYVADVYVPEGTTRLTVHHQLGAVGYLQTDDYSFLPKVNVPFRRALVSLTFDDSWLTDYDNALPVLEAHDAVSTHYVLTGLLGQPDRMTTSMVVALRDRGSEIASHTVDHPDLTTLSATELARQLAEPKPALEALGLGPIRNFATPYGAYNSNVVAAIAKQYQSHRTTDVGYNTKDNFNIYGLKVQNIRSTTTPEEVATWAAQAAADRSWLILVYHDVVDPPSTIYGTTPAALDAHLTVLSQHDLPIVTVQQALTEILPQL